MSLIRAAFVVGVVAVLTGCKRDRASHEPAAAQVPVSREQATPSRFEATGWPEDAGPIVILPAPSPGDVRLVLPELTDNALTDTSSFELDSLPNGAVSLYSRSVKPISATIVGGGTEETPRGCKTWPTARLSHYAGDKWQVGLATHAALPLPLASWGALLAADSTAAAADVISVVSAERNDSIFRGIPYTIRFLHRLELNGARAVVADVVRRINTEANVREEHTLLVAERSRATSHFVEAFRETERGREDEVRVPEVIASVLLGDNRRPALFISLEYSEGSRLFLLERTGSARWVLRWRSAYAGC